MKKHVNQWGGVSAQVKELVTGCVGYSIYMGVVGNMINLENGQLYFNLNSSK